MSGPADGYAYNPIELNAIWDIPSPSATEIAQTRTKVFEFHRRMGDTEANARITMDTVAQLFDKEPPGILDYDAPFIADTEDRYVIDIGSDK